MGFGMNVAHLADKMQGNQGTLGQVGASVGLFLDGQSETPDNHDTGLYFNTVYLAGDSGLQILTFKVVTPGCTAFF